MHGTWVFDSSYGYFGLSVQYWSSVLTLSIRYHLSDSHSLRDRVSALTLRLSVDSVVRSTVD